MLQKKIARDDEGLYFSQYDNARLKNNASKILLARSIQLDLQGKHKRAANIFETVCQNCSPSFNLDKEFEKAKKIAVNINI